MKAKKQPTANKKEVLKLKKAMFNYDSKITEKKEPTQQQKDMVIDYYKKQGFELYKTSNLKPKLDKLALIEAQTRIVRNNERCLKAETDYLLNVLRNYNDNAKDNEKGYVTNN